jgi:hypothetical protein
MKLNTHLHLVPRSKICGAILPLPQYVFMALCLVKHRKILPLLLPCTWNGRRGTFEKTEYQTEVGGAPEIKC